MIDVVVGGLALYSDLLLPNPKKAMNTLVSMLIMTILTMGKPGLIASKIALPNHIVTITPAV